MISFLFVDTERVWRGGQEQLFTLLQGLSRRGHNTSLVCQPGTLLNERARQIGVRVHSITIRSEVGLISFMHLFAVLLRVRPDVLAFNTPKPIFMGTAASLLTSVRIRIIFRRVSFPLRKNAFTRFKYRWGIDCIVAISESIRSQLQICGVSASKIKTIYEGLDLALYPRQSRLSAHRPGEPIVVGTIAHLSREKGLRYLVEAASLIPDVRTKMRFVIVGDGECRQELEEQVRKRNLEDCFQFAGFQNDTIEHSKSFDIFVLPSLSEGLSSAILAAMALSLPVISTAVGGIPELIHHGENGLLVAPGDPVGLAGAIRQLAGDPEACLRMGRRGRQQIEERFTLERKTLETEQLCYSLLQGPARVSRAAHA